MFRCLPTSRTEYASQTHIPGWEPPTFDQGSFNYVRRLSELYYGSGAEPNDEPYEPVVKEDDRGEKWL